MYYQGHQKRSPRCTPNCQAAQPASVSPFTPLQRPQRRHWAVLDQRLSSTALYAMIKSCVLSVYILALTGGLESKKSFCLAAVHHSPVSDFADYMNNSFVKRHFLISDNSNKDFASPDSHGK